jgi:hypothetical protein
MPGDIGGGFGWHNPWPFEWGGGPTIDETVYESWRDTLGSLPAKDDTGIDGLWRQVRSEAIASVLSMSERAMLQAFPQAATDHLPLWEAFLGLQAGDKTEEQRREAVADRYTRKALADDPHLSADLVAIDSRFSIRPVERDKSTVMVLGRPFDATAPNYASSDLLTVVLATTERMPDAHDTQSMMRAKDVLQDALPSWVDFGICTRIGFFLDLSPLDVTALTDP